MIAKEAEVLRLAAWAVAQALKAEKANILAGSPRDKLLLCEANSLQAGELLKTLIVRWLTSL